MVFWCTADKRFKGRRQASPADAALLVQGDLTTGFNCRFSVDFASTRA